jgi:trehalose 6-phosphate phosphatase
VGNHGIERAFVPRRGRPEALTADVDEASHEAIHAAERIGEEMPRLINEPWLVVESKPPSVAFHWRQAPDIAAAGARVMSAVEELDPGHVLERFPGRRVLELRPPGAVAKGEAFERMVAEWQPRSVFLLGDDVSDALAFRSLRELRSRGVTDGVAVAVQARAEVPPAVLEAADIVLASPVEATRVLSALARRLRQ